MRARAPDARASAQRLSRTGRRGRAEWWQGSARARFLPLDRPVRGCIERSARAAPSCASLARQLYSCTPRPPASSRTQRYDAERELSVATVRVTALEDRAVRRLGVGRLSRDAMPKLQSYKDVHKTTPVSPPLVSSSFTKLIIREFLYRTPTLGKSPLVPSRLSFYRTPRTRTCHRARLRETSIRRQTQHRTWHELRGATCTCMYMYLAST